MKLAIIGVEDSVKSNIFSALTSRAVSSGRDAQVGVVRVPDERVDKLSAMFKPQKTTYAQVEFMLPAGSTGRNAKDSVWQEVRPADALLMVARNYSNGGPARPAAEVRQMISDMVFADFMVVEKRLEILAADAKRGKAVNTKERELLEACRQVLEQDQPIRTSAELAGAPALRCFSLLSSKPFLALFNNAEDDTSAPAGIEELGCDWLVARGKLEAEIAAMSEEERSEFLQEYGITESALDRVIKRSYEVLGLISFFTVGEDEVKAWTIRRGTPAVEAAGAVHSDIQKGFIRAEVVSYADLMETGSLGEAKKQAKTRLEGKTYLVADGDLIDFRFNV